MKRLLMGLILAGTFACADSWNTPIKLTSVGPDNNRNYDTTESAIAINSSDESYIIVWEGNESRTGLAPGEKEIFGQIYNKDGSSRSSQSFRISFMGASQSINYDGRSPEVVYNPDTNEYLVVWYGDHNQSGLVEGEFEIFARRVNASSGQPVASMKRVSDMGPSANRSYDALTPHVSYNTQDNLYLVIWHGEEGNAASPLGSFEIYGQLLDGNLNEIGRNDFKISTMGPDNSADYNAYSATSAYNPTNNTFLVTWYGSDDRNGRVPGEFEVYARVINASNGNFLGTDSTSVSFVGLNGDIARAAKYPDVAYNSQLNEFLVVWSADDSKDGHVGNEFEIYGQVLNADGTQKGKNDFLISNMGPIGNNNFDAFRPKVEYVQASNQYAIVWRGDTTVDGEFEIYSQRLSGDKLIRLGKTSERLSHAGPDDSLLYDARRVNIAVNPSTSQTVTIWEQEDESTTQVEGEFEVFSSTLQTSDFIIDTTMSGTWYDPQRNGEGYIIEILPNKRVLMTYFTYLPNETLQAWILGVGTYEGNKIIIDDLQITSGGIFGASFDPNLVQRLPWGELSFEFNSCDDAVINYNSTDLAYGSGDHQMIRLTKLGGLECGQSNQTQDPYNGLSASWYDPSHNGEGWYLEYLGNNRFVMYWFTYNSTGKQQWLLSVGTIDAQNVINFDRVTITNGTSFGDAFNANDVNRLTWGSMQMTINDCQSITVDYNSDFSEYGQGQLNAVRLTSLDGLSCQL